MKKENLKDREILLLTAGMVTFIGVFTLLAKKLFTSRSVQLKKHSFLKLPKETIQKYLDKKGSKIKFEFTDDNGRIKLNFLGFTKDNKLCLEKRMERIKVKSKELENIDFGLFSEDEHKEPLHNILSKEPLRDWFLSPEECSIKEGYVSYRMGDFDPCTAQSATYAAYKINPCPPGC
mgnify:CR=1 FL=1